MTRQQDLVTAIQRLFPLPEDHFDYDFHGRLASLLNASVKDREWWFIETIPSSGWDCPNQYVHVPFSNWKYAGINVWFDHSSISQLNPDVSMMFACDGKLERFLDRIDGELEASDLLDAYDRAMRGLM